ncbi:hypothetical protein CONLIGDRAFT_719421 [Coniochaeta ligniaria NRRL 30616]|uniref:Uncharacterized protein n=1 Tax=Coniochaeta ligniaria NRRL 30616 TaxID=1408157 RepID=A0A1J7I666_9PEZI|nr:hypothetical protein CONLIGDRAFT_719421 [Coniochaeta ligniaria NRRL 30616]
MPHVYTFRSSSHLLSGSVIIKATVIKFHRHRRSSQARSTKQATAEKAQPTRKAATAQFSTPQEAAARTPTAETIIDEIFESDEIKLAAFSNQSHTTATSLMLKEARVKDSLENVSFSKLFIDIETSKPVTHGGTRARRPSGDHLTYPIRACAYHFCAVCGDGAYD